MKVYKFLDELASSSPAPGGGSASALLCSIGASLVCMVCRLTIGKKGYEQSEAELKKVLEEAETLRKNAEKLIDEDAVVFKEVMNAYKTPKENPERQNIIQNALRKATLTPIEVAKIGVRVLDLSKIAAFKGNVNSITDAGVAALAAEAGVRGAVLNAKINLRSMKDDMQKGELLSELGGLDERSKTTLNEIYNIITFKLNS
jgi:formiminotetrahydrofolate cyclodeaminase